MTQPVDNAIAKIAAIVAGVSGIRQAPTYPTETQSVDPFAITYVYNGTVNAGVIGSKKMLLSIAVDLYIPRLDLARDMATLTPFLDLITNALLGQVSGSGGLFSGSITTFERLDIEFLPNMTYGAVTMIGYRFLMNNVKLLLAL